MARCAGVEDSPFLNGLGVSANCLILGGDWARGQKNNISIYFIIVIARPKPSEMGRLMVGVVVRYHTAGRWGHCGGRRGRCKLLPNVVHQLLWLICRHLWMHSDGHHHGSKVGGRHGLLPPCQEGWALHWCAGNQWGAARGRGQDGYMHSPC